MIAIGFDIGSSFIKAALVDTETGKSIERIRLPETEIPIIASEIGWAEQDLSFGGNTFAGNKIPDKTNISGSNF